MSDEIDDLIEKLLSSGLKSAAKNLENLLLKLEGLEGDQEFQEFTLSLKKEVKTFLEDFHRSQHGLLRHDWLRIATYDLQNLKRRLIHLRELLRSDAVKSKELEPARILREIYEEGGMSEATWLMVVNHPSLKNRSRETKKALLRLSSLLQELRECKNGRDN